MGYVLVNYKVHRDKKVDSSYLGKLRFNKVTPSDLIDSQMNL